MNEPLLVLALRGDIAPEQLCLRDWNTLLRQAGVSLLTGRLGRWAMGYGEADIPAEVRPHLESESILVQRQYQSVKWEQHKLKQEAGALQQKIILLKGSAYVAADLPAAQGRLFSDVDVLLPEDNVTELERQLVQHGWHAVQMDEYDEKYYRQWMHEIPPLRHSRRKTTLDIHHRILPRTAVYKSDPDKLLASARQLADGWRVLCPEDMVIHSATHLFHDGELEHGLRDIVDLHELLKHFGENKPGFWERLVPRAIELDLVNPLYYGLHYSCLILNTPIPDQVMATAQAGKPNAIMSPVMDWLFMRALRPDHPSCDLSLTGLARWLLYIRSHYLRMPLRLLVPHLVRKAWKRRFGKEPESGLQGENQA